MKISSSASERRLIRNRVLRAIQYLAVEILFVMIPVEVCAEIGERMNLILTQKRMKIGIAHLIIDFR